MPEELEGLKPEDVVVSGRGKGTESEEAPVVEEGEEEEEVEVEEGEESGEESTEEEGGEESTEEESEESAEDDEAAEVDGVFVDPESGVIVDEEGKEMELVYKDGEEEVDWAALSEEVGIEIESNDDVVDALKELAEYKSLSPALQKAIEIEQNKGDVAAYFRMLAVDPEKLSDRDVLWEQYVAENPKRASDNPKFARQDFDRRQAKEYALLTEYENLSASEQEDFLAEHKAEIDYLKEKRKFDAEAARTALRETREKAQFYGPEKPAAQTDADIQAIVRAHEAGYKQAIKDFDVVSIDIGDDYEFNVSLSETNKEVALDWMRNPEKLLNELGFSKNKIDYDTLAGWATLIADIKYGTFGERFRQALIDNKDINTLERTLDAPGIKNGSGKASIQADEWEAVGAAFEKKRMETKKKR